MNDDMINLKVIRKNGMLIKVKSGLCKFSLSSFYINNKINSVKQTIFK